MLMLSPFIITLLIVEGVVIFFGTIAFFFSFIIAKKYDENISTSYQYELSKQGYLVSTIISFILMVKIPLFLFFVWTMDSISSLVPGAMCAVGIVDATPEGIYMLVLKIFNLFLLSGWLLVNHEDGKTINSKFLKTKFKLFIPIYILLLAEFILEFSHFSGIRVDTAVLCCSDIFAASSIDKVAFWHTNGFILGLFYAFFILNFIWAYFKVDILLGMFSLSFMLISIYAIIRFFSPYIYELPTHKCPFCMLQADYGYVGYLIYALIFIGTIPGFFVFIMELLDVKIPNYWYRVSMVANSALVAVLSYYPMSYYIKHGVWL
ncbi:hypothetical protein [Campylobacter geochelonis]|uniref:Uncharacterized protein n=1 Tax=Campylobacter geochelonis TaxID=1780362 RepID=A0A128EGF3_9BACT|nr:hypothetical protein [Campylobacter geochelonis]QKF70876.1 putative membrane protein [Campylobacter geochelonis]CZE47964.1 Uncharacterised protein [Campylobacter geochelonis]CZE51370.1 Uncharacterised protein [Campylobacter geochelonis]